MNGLKNILTFFALLWTLTSCGQNSNVDTKNKEHTALAKLISFEGGDKIHFAKFKIIKNLSDTSVLNDTIIVGYYNYKQPDPNIENVILTIKKYDGQTTLKNYFICSDYDGQKNIQKAKVEFIDFKYWEDCETGKGDCKTLNFTRTKNDKNWFLIMPCGGTETAITISGQNYNKELQLYHDNCPPYFDLSQMTDGNYSANMRACGLGGTISFSLITTK